MRDTSNQDDAPFQRAKDHFFWGKYQSGSGKSLPLAMHCLDVAVVFRFLCELPGFRRSLEKAAGKKLTDKDFDRLAVLAMLHDGGKLNFGFQLKPFNPIASKGGHIQEIEAIFDDVELQERFLSAIKWDTLQEWFCDDASAENFLLAAWSHHGRPFIMQGKSSGTALCAKKWWNIQGGIDPMSGWAELMDCAAIAFPGAFEPGLPLPDKPKFQHRFCGILMLADWLGSHPAWFPIETTSFESRLKADQYKAAHCLEAVGLSVEKFRSGLSSKKVNFEARFSFPPRPLQKLFDSLGPGDKNAGLLIAESETGSGKTEAALHWFCNLFENRQVDSLYFALPTRVAARELYSRIYQYVKKFFPQETNRPPTVLAVPGYARVDGCPSDRVLSDETDLWIDEEELARRFKQWGIEHPKRFLANTVTVGTIDQALMSCIQTAHAHLRSVCLDRCLLVVDEVHASDTYMSRLLSFLLEHHLSIGGHALLLSATLGSRARTEFLRTAGTDTSQPEISKAITAPYPSLSLADGTVFSAERKEENFRCIRMLPFYHAENPERIIPELYKALSAGARVLVVLNTVGRAITLIRRIISDKACNPDWLFSVEGIHALHHGRFAPADREKLDQTVTACFGPGSPGGAKLLLGTQTLEQSLDVDADLLVTDICPADVLLQRIGRLHRHDRNRPPGYEEAKCLVLLPQEQGFEKAIDSTGDVLGAYRRMGYGSVYTDLRVLQRTADLIAANQKIRIPDDNRWFVEEAMHPERLSAFCGEKWESHAQKIEGSEVMQELSAMNAAAIYDKPFNELTFNDFGGKAATRLGVDSLRLPLDRSVRSPFGIDLKEMVIPGHMKPESPEESIRVEQELSGVIKFCCADKHYLYSSFGLEEEK